MNRYAEVFDRLKTRNEAAFIPFAVAGDPDFATSESIFRAYVDGGADILEIGYPFSDPVADGPVNQRAAQRAITAGLDHTHFFSIIKNLRRSATIPIGLLLYANTVNHLGYGEFCRRAADAGVDSLLVADMPPEESTALNKAMRTCGLARVYIVSELTPAARMRYICEQVDAFVYVVSRLGATGVSSRLSGSVAGTLKALRKVTKKPLAAGFGISTPAQVREVCRAGADAAIVGSALVKIIEEHGDNSDLPAVLRAKVAEYKAATRGLHR